MISRNYRKLFILRKLTYLPYVEKVSVPWTVLWSGPSRLDWSADHGIISAFGRVKTVRRTLERWYQSRVLWRDMIRKKVLYRLDLEKKSLVSTINNVILRGVQKYKTFCLSQRFLCAWNPTYKTYSKCFIPRYKTLSMTKSNFNQWMNQT